LVCQARSGVFSMVQSPNAQLDVLYSSNNVVVQQGSAPPVVQLLVAQMQLACHAFVIDASATGISGPVTNLTLLMGTNVLGSFPAATAEVSVTHDFPGQVTFSAEATDNNGTVGSTNLTVTFTTLPVEVLDPVGFQSNHIFKLCMEGEAGKSYKVQARDDVALGIWADLGVMENTNGIWRYADLAATNSIYRYYRTVRLP